MNEDPWIYAPEEPAISGDYFCQLFDAREGYNDEWFEVVEFRVSKAFGNKWNTANFDAVIKWKKIPN